jgi:hypothetical protein
MNYQTIKRRLSALNSKFMEEAVLCRLMVENNERMPRIMVISGLSFEDARKAIEYMIPESKYEQAKSFALYYEDRKHWLDLGERFLRSMPSVSEEEVQTYSPFIVECMRWGAKI